MSIRLALDIAEWSRRWGSGVIELTARGNLQLRGVSRTGLPELQAALATAGLLDSNPRSEAVRNIALSPLSDIDPHAILNILPMAGDLDERLRTKRRLHDLPGKFGYAIDAGGSFGTAAADVTFVACRTDNGPGFAVRLAGDATAFFGPCAPDRLPDVAVSLGLAFLAAASGQASPMRRMRDLVASIGATAVGEAAGLDAFSFAGVPAPRRKPLDHDGLELTSSHSELPNVSDRGPNWIGLHTIGCSACVGVGWPFGQSRAEDFADLVEMAAGCGARDLRLTPWRMILFPMSSVIAASQMASRCAIGPFILNPADPRRRVAACPGAPHCHHGSTPARADAAALAMSLAGHPKAGILVHVSGCEKGCAHPASAPFTLIGRGGFYDLVLNGTALGQAVLENLTLAQAAEFLLARTKDTSR